MTLVPAVSPPNETIEQRSMPISSSASMRTDTSTRHSPDKNVFKTRDIGNVQVRKLTQDYAMVVLVDARNPLLGRNKISDRRYSHSFEFVEYHFSQVERS